MSSLQDEFDRVDGRPIEYRGRTVCLSYWVKLTGRSRLTIRFLRAVVAPPQGLGLTAEACQLSVGRTSTRHMVLWRDTAPDTVHVEVTDTQPGARIGIMNQWRDEVYGTTLLGLNNAAMDVQPQLDGSLLMRCSDGCAGPDFNDLVVECRVEPVGA